MNRESRENRQYDSSDLPVFREVISITTKTHLSHSMNKHARVGMS